MPSAERAAAAVLARQTDWRAIEKKRSEGERFRVMPFVRAAGFENFPTPIEHVLFDLRNDFEIVRNPRQAVDDLFQHLGANRGRLALCSVMRLKNGGRFLEPRLIGRFFSLD